MFKFFFYHVGWFKGDKRDEKSWRSNREMRSERGREKGWSVRKKKKGRMIKLL